MKTDTKPTSNTAENGNKSKPLLYDGILSIMKENWTCKTGSFDAFWYGYEALKDCLFDIGIRDCSINDLKNAMKELSKQNKVELKPSYDVDFKLSGRGWYAII
jgi:hypothetical protein